MFAKAMLVIALATLAGCGGSQSAEESAPPPRPTVFDPMTGTIGRAQGVQQTVDEQAAEQRKRIDEAER